MTMTANNQAARQTMRELQRMADRLCTLILTSDYPDIDITIERASLRSKCEELFPDRMDLYDMVYESRFDRLMEQFREEESEE